MSEKELEQLKAKVSPVFRKYGVIRADLFGSRATGKAKPDSDYDLLVEFSPDAKIGLFKLQSLEEQLKLTLGGKIDLATPKALNKHIREDVIRTTKVIYGG